MLVRTGKAWFVVPTALNLFIGPLALFHFPSYGLEAFFNAGYYWLIVVAVVLALVAMVLVLRGFLADEISGAKIWSIVAIMLVVVLSMATLRHGMRLSLVSPVMEASIAKSQAFQKEAQAAFEAAKLAPIATAAGPRGKVLAEQHGCLACHGETEKIVGPAYAEVAKRGYSAERIVRLVHEPVPSDWPDFESPMPAQPDVPEADIREIAAWINSLN